MSPALRTVGSPRAREDGFTLVEVLVAVTLSLILTAMGLSVVTTFFNAQRAVTTTYTNLNQLLPIGTAFQQYIRAAVSPAPTPTALGQPGVPGQPVPPFGIYSADHALTCPPTLTVGTEPRCLTRENLIFFTNIDNHVAKIVATYSATPVTSEQGMFRVFATAAEETTCPTSDTTFRTSCKFTTTHDRRIAFTVQHVTPTAVATTPIFTYYLTGSTTPATVTTFTACTQTTGSTPLGCPADSIQSVGFNLVVNENPRIGRTADQETVTYEVSSSSQAFNPVVG
jgi:prepilin-type N-terminal cleavage/methylation domain-containing protein